ncbi:hypothetical protein [Corallococcus exiguus]
MVTEDLQKLVAKFAQHAAAQTDAIWRGEATRTPRTSTRMNPLRRSNE